ncbi:MAG: hypothetical protein HPY90_04940 [Syntrophothermus sp.]|nr:hypothetical protein [Syntrophothermus sp.]NSW82614.1 hypothetical protein [Syntrophothermus sp.]
MPGTLKRVLAGLPVALDGFLFFTRVFWSVKAAQFNNYSKINHLKELV